MTSWQTSLAGLLAFLAASFTALWYLLDSDPSTEPNWNLVIVTAIGAIGASRARDNSVSDEQAGAGMHAAAKLETRPHDHISGLGSL